MLLIGLLEASEVLAEEEDEQHDAYRDAGIREVEHRLEEHERLIAGGQPGRIVEREPEETDHLAGYREGLRPIEVDEREVEHIHHPSLEPFALRHQSRTLIGPLGNVPVAVGEPASVEDTVNDIARSARQDHRDNDDKGRRDELPADGLEEHPAEEQRHEDTEAGKRILIDKLHTIGHAIVLDEGQIKPRRHFYRLTKVEVRLDVNLDGLINQDKGHEEPYGQQALLLADIHSILFIDHGASL